MGLWFATSPNVESLASQIFAGTFVIGSYFLAQYVRVWRPQRLAARAAAQRKDNAVSATATVLKTDAMPDAIVSERR